jgi:lipoprotein-anchoring transpeptidase ErfK/SrfK
MVSVLLLAGVPAQAAWRSPPRESRPNWSKPGVTGPASARLRSTSTSAPGVPANSGAGRRAVYSNSQQRVWIIEADGRLVRDYPVSGRRGLPKPGTYTVYSRTRVSRSGSLALNYMVRFAQGRNLAIGFHQIPLRPNGSAIQTDAELGQHRSHGCVRQSGADAAFMWEWGQIGSVVVVLA